VSTQLYNDGVVIVLSRKSVAGSWPIPCRPICYYQWAVRPTKNLIKQEPLQDFRISSLLPFRFALLPLTVSSSNFSVTTIRSFLIWRRLAPTGRMHGSTWKR